MLILTDKPPISPNNGHDSDVTCLLLPWGQLVKQSDWPAYCGYNSQFSHRADSVQFGGSIDYFRFLLKAPYNCHDWFEYPRDYEDDGKYCHS